MEPTIGEHQRAGVIQEGPHGVGVCKRGRAFSSAVGARSGFLDRLCAMPRRSKRNTKASPAHVHLDGKVTSERVDAFANASHHDQLQALTELRRRASSHFTDWIASWGAVVAFVVAGTALMLTVGGEVPSTSPVVGVTMRWLAFLTIVVVIVFAGITLRWIRNEVRNRTRAAVLLAAYEAELTRRYSATGAKARRWRRARSIEWGV